MTRRPPEADLLPLVWRAGTSRVAHGHLGAGASRTLCGRVAVQRASHVQPETDCDRCCAIVTRGLELARSRARPSVSPPQTPCEDQGTLVLSPPQSHAEESAPSEVQAGASARDAEARFLDARGSAEPASDAL